MPSIVNKKQRVNQISDIIYAERIDPPWHHIDLDAPGHSYTKTVFEIYHFVKVNLIFLNLI